MFIVNLFGFVMITSTIVIGVLFFSKASAIEKEIDLEIRAKSTHDKDEKYSADYDLTDFEHGKKDDETIPHSTEDLDDWQKDESAA